MNLFHTDQSQGKDSSASTQRYVDVEEVRDGIVILRNGSLRGILLVSSINFDLKSVEEQDSIIYQYQTFLNSIEFPIEIVISSRKLNINPYLDYLKRKEAHIDNELLRFQLSEYQIFIKNLAEVSNIMSKFFYIIVPFYPIESTKSGILDMIFRKGISSNSEVRKEELFETYKNQLLQRVEHVRSALNGTGVKVTMLKTEETIEVLYNAYNPSTHTNTIIKGVENIEMR